MPHRTTVVELSIHPDTLFSTTQAWAQDNGFSIYEKKDNRIIYARDMWNAKAWLTVESLEEHGKLEAWLSLKGVGPEFAGNVVVGWKMPLPNGLTFGTPLKYRKQFQKLVNGLKEKTTSGRITEATWQDGHPQPSMNKSAWTKSLSIFGVVYLVLGLLAFIPAIMIGIQGVYPDIVRQNILDGCSNLIFGSLFIISSKALNKERTWGIWLIVATILLGVIFNMERGITPNYFSIGFQVLMIWQLFKLKKEWQPV